MLDETQDVALHPQGSLVVLLTDPVLHLLLAPPPPVGLPLPCVLGRHLLGNALEGWVGSGEGEGQGGACGRHVLEIGLVQRERICY